MATTGRLAQGRSDRLARPGLPSRGCEGPSALGGRTGWGGVSKEREDQGEPCGYQLKGATWALVGVGGLRKPPVGCCRPVGPGVTEESFRGPGLALNSSGLKEPCRGSPKFRPPARAASVVGGPWMSAGLQRTGPPNLLPRRFQNGWANPDRLSAPPAHPGRHPAALPPSLRTPDGAYRHATGLAAL